MIDNMRTKIIFYFTVLAFVTLILPGCATDADQPPPGELPLAPVLPSYVGLSPNPPPPEPVEIPQPVSDLQHQTWRPGHWSYEDSQFTWVPGTIIQKPAFTAVWVPDRWEKHEYGWVFVCGFWQ